MDAAVLGEPAPVAPPPAPRPDADAVRRLLRLAVALAALVVGIAAVVVATRVPDAPVVSSTSTVTWPRAGEAPTPTTLLLVPYRPASLEVTVPCGALRAARARSGDVTVFATTVGAPGDGLAVRTRPGTDGAATTVQVLASGRLVPVEVPDTDCGLRIVADAAGLTVTAGDGPARTVPGAPVPEVFAATTDLSGADADGLALTARTPAWFDNAPSAEKSALLRAAPALALVALLLVVLARVLTPTPGPAPRTLRELVGVRGLAVLRTRWRRVRRRAAGIGARPEVPARAAGRLAVDVVVALGLAWWSIVGPLTDDDGFAAVIARQAGAGDPANYYRWFNASEVPFASNQRLLAALVDLGAGPLEVRTASVGAGLFCWVVLTRGVLRPGLGAAGRTVGVRLLAALALAVWWLPYDLGARPEPWVALGTVVVTALVLRAVHRGERGHPVALLALAALVAGLTVSVAPSGLIAAAPFLLCLPRLVRVLADAGPRGGSGRVARATRVVLPAAHLAVVAGLAAVPLVVVFADQSWHGFVVATDIHRQIGPNQPWYAEWLRYGYLFGEDSWGAAAKRVPVVVGLVLAGTGLVVLARGAGRGVGIGMREPVLLLGLLPAGFALLAVTPSKWSHHFGALAGLGAVGVVAVIVALGRACRGREPAVAAAAGVATVALVLGAAFAFSGPNAWWAYSGFGLPGSTGPQRPFDSVVPWLLVALATAVLAGVLARWRDPDDEGRAGRAALAAAPIVPAVTAAAVAAVSVLLLTTSFAAAGDRGGRWSLAAQNRAELAGQPGACGLQDRLQVLATVPGGPLTPVRGSTDSRSGFVADGGAVDPPPVRPDQTDGTDGTPDTRDGRFTWGSRVDGDGSVGEMTTAWFGLTRPARGQELAVGVAGRTSDGASLTWEFGQGNRVVGERPVVEDPEPDRGYRGYAGDAEQERRQDAASTRDRWRTVTLTPDQVPGTADRVRLRATDDRTDTGGWIAFTGPRLVVPEPLTDWLADRGPVLVDWAVALAWPCTGELPRVAGGIARTPGAIITTPTAPVDPVPGERTTNPSPPGDIVPERWTGGTAGLFLGRDPGGSFAGLEAVGSLRELDTRLPDEPARRWGRVLVPDLGDLETDRYEATTTTRTLPGTEGDPAPEVEVR